MSQLRPDITIEVEYLPFPPIKVRVRAQGDYPGALASGSFEHRGEKHVAWIVYDLGEPTPFQRLREIVGRTIALIEEDYFRKQQGDDPHPSRNEGDIVVRSVLVREGYAEQYWAELNTLRLGRFQHFCVDRPFEEWGVEVVDGKFAGRRFMAYVYKPGQEPREVVV